MRLLKWFGGTKAGIWSIKHLISPVDRWMYRRIGRAASTATVGPVMLLTTVGRHSGLPRATPLLYLRDEGRLVVCNVNPGFERPNPWTLNLRANPTAQVQVGADVGSYVAHEATAEELARYWPRLVAVWPAYQRFYERTRERTVFVLERAIPAQLNEHQT